MLRGIALSTVVFELLGYALLGLCLWHALHERVLRRIRLIELGTGVLYGLVLERLTILQFHAYQYGHFLIMFGPVPLAVAVGWGIILYSAMAFAETFALPAWAAPALVGLLGLNIDLAMDAVAIRLHLWQWLSLTLNEQWFGVPYVNFFAWFVVLCSFSALLWRGRPLTVKPGWQGPLAALGALLGSVIILALLDELVVQYDAHGGIVWLPVVIVVTGALIVVGLGVWARRSSARPAPMKAPLSSLVPMVVPFYFHVCFLIMLFVGNITPHLLVLVAISLAMLTVSIVLHGLLLWHVLLVQPTTSSHQALPNETFGVK
jgi:Carotenoid biosynthesis protein